MVVRKGQNISKGIFRKVTFLKNKLKTDQKTVYKINPDVRVSHFCGQFSGQFVIHFLDISDMLKDTFWNILTFIESIGGSHSSINGNESITITVSEFKAGKNANFLKNKKIQKLFVEYSFLDLKSEETETPFALPKPKSAGETIVFNFSKV